MRKIQSKQGEVECAVILMTKQIDLGSVETLKGGPKLVYGTAEKRQSQLSSQNSATNLSSFLLTKTLNIFLSDNAHHSKTFLFVFASVDCPLDVVIKM